MRKLLLFTGMCMLVFSSLHAQTADRKVGVTLMGGVNQYNGDHGNRIFAFGERFYGYGALMLSYYISPSFNVALHGSTGDFGFRDDVQSFRGNKTDLDLLAVYKFNNGKIMDADSKYEPFVAAGIGMSGYRGREIPEVSWNGYRMNDFNIPVGLGFKYHWKEWLSFQYMFLYKFTDHDTRDGYLRPELDNGRKDRFVQQSVGATLNLSVLK